MALSVEFVSLVKDCIEREIISSDQSDQNTLSSVNKNNSNTLFV